MAYAAVASLYHTIRLLLNSSRTSIAASTQKILKIALQRAKKLQETLEKYDDIRNNTEGVTTVEARIRDESRKLVDAIESHALAQFQSHTTHTTLSLNLDHLRNEINCFIKTSKKMETEYLEELHKPAPQGEEASPLPLTMDAAENQIEMVGLTDGFLKIRDFITEEEGSARLNKISITGMAGIGKTTLAKKLFHDSLLKEKFQIRAFVRVGQNYDFEEISRAIIAQLNVISVDNSSDDRIIVEGGKKFLIVLDDVWDDSFKERFKTLLPVSCDGSCILLTSRITTNLENGYQMRFLNEEESWELLRKKVIGEEEEEEECPLQLVKVGKKIAKNCEGLPLLIVTVAEILSKAEKNLEYWEEVARMKNSVFEEAIDETYEILLPSYHYIGQASRTCFLYMGAFPRNCVVRRSRIINLWNAEGFSGAKFILIDNALFNLEDLVSNNLVVVRQLSLSGMETKSFNLHFVYWHVSKREGERNQFLHILNSYAAEEEDGSNSIEESIKEKRHLSIYHNTLLAMKEVHSSIESLGSSLHSVLCTGPYHQYQVPICLELRLLRVLDAVTIRFYEFPVEVVNLIQLRYLSLTTNANLPPFINNLWFLQFLIVHQHFSIDRSCLGESLYVPVEIWELKELEHLQIIGRNLPHPPIGVILPKLIHLLDVGVQSCEKEVLESIPKLEKLRIQIELAPNPNADQTMRWCDQISSLKNLTSLKTVIKNPKLLPKPRVPPRLLSISIKDLQKLSLSGFGYPWEDMSKIAELPWLQQLKLHSYAFRGEKWEGKGKSCWSVMDLLIEDSDLVQWSAVDGAFPNLCQLTMKNCYKLREIPFLESVLKIELVDCNPIAETCAKIRARQCVECELQVSYSWK